MKLPTPPRRQLIVSESSGMNKTDRRKFQAQEHILLLLVLVNPVTTSYPNTRAAVSEISVKWEEESNQVQVKYPVQVPITPQELIYHQMEDILPPKCKTV